MVTAQGGFNKAIASTPIKPPTIPIIGNVTALPLLNINDIQEDLQNQLTHKVRWTESIQYLLNNGIYSFMEIGSGSVLSGLIRRINRNVTANSIGTPEDIQTFQRL
jgi:[acyl-carrier-protein] S-malonyltransferase